MDDAKPDAIARARKRRLVLIVGITVIVEAALALIAHFGPALANLIYPVYFIVAIVGALTFWHAVRRRPGQDRRHADRREARRAKREARDAE